MVTIEDPKIINTLDYDVYIYRESGELVCFPKEKDTPKKAYLNIVKFLIISTNGIIIKCKSPKEKIDYYLPYKEGIFYIVPPELKVLFPDRRDFLVPINPVIIHDRVIAGYEDLMV